MPLSQEEVAPGAIAYFNADALNGDAAVQKTGSPVDRRGNGNQFVCYKVEGETSYWTPLTASYRRERLAIQPEWVANGYGPLAGGGVYLQDGRGTYKGSTASFVAAAAAENPFEGGRPQLLSAGLEEVLRVIAERGGQL
jgi:hypothetical protein